MRMALEKQIAALEEEDAVPSPTTLVVQERKTPRVHVHSCSAATSLRKGAIVTPDVPRVLPPLRTGGKLPASTRLDLAAGWSIGKNPLTARVTMNRFWQQYFGTRPRRDRERLRHPGHAADASRVARLAGDGVHGARTGDEGDAPADRDLGDLSAIVERPAGAGDARSAQSAAGPAESPAARRRDGARRGPGVERLAESARSAARASFRRSPRASTTSRRCRANWKPSTGPDRYRRGMYTSSGARRRTRA